MVERQLPKLNVAGSIPVSRSNSTNFHYPFGEMSDTQVCASSFVEPAISSIGPESTRSSLYGYLSKMPERIAPLQDHLKR